MLYTCDIYGETLEKVNVLKDSIKLEQVILQIHIPRGNTLSPLRFQFNMSNLKIRSQTVVS
jgi:hypothetical protein